MIRERDKVVTKSGRKGVVVLLLDWKDKRPQSAVVRHEDPLYPVNGEEVVYKIDSISNE